MAAENRIDDLARICETTVRSLRVLHDKDLLPPPLLRGRTGFYDDHHVARVRLVLRLQERGFTLNAIRELLAAWESGRDLSDVLGLEAALTKPWTDEEPGQATLGELEIKLGRRVTPDELDGLIELGVLRPPAEDAGTMDAGTAARGEPDTVYTLPSPMLVDAGIQMARSGIPLTSVTELNRGLREDMRLAATKLVEAVGPHLLADTPDNLPEHQVGDLVETVEELRRQARNSVAAWFGIVMDEAIADYVSKVSGWAMSQDFPMPSTEAGTEPSTQEGVRESP